MNMLRVLVLAFLSTCMMLVGAVPAQAAKAALAINDVTVNEPNWPDYEAPAVFTVSLNRVAREAVTVHWATSAPKNVWDPEIEQESGTVTIPQGQQQATLTVTVLREASNSNDRQFTVTLSGAAGATIGDGVGVGTIINSDRAGWFTCLAEGGSVAPPNATYPIPGLLRFGGTIGGSLECTRSQARTEKSATQSVGGLTVTVSAFDLAVAPAPEGKSSSDTRAEVGDGAVARASTGVITITGPDVNVRIESLRSDARIRCEALQVAPVVSGSGKVTGVTINGTNIDQITDHRVYELRGTVRLEFNRQTVETDDNPVQVQHLAQDAVVINHRALVVGHAEVGYLREPCSS